MTARIELANALADLAGQDAVAVHGETVGEVLRDLTDRHPALAPLVWRNGGFNDQLVVFHNRQDVRRLNGLETLVRDGDELMLITAVEGG